MGSQDEYISGEVETLIEFDDIGTRDEELRHVHQAAGRNLQMQMSVVRILPNERKGIPHT